MAEINPEVVEEEVLEWLPTMDVEMLTKICRELEIEIRENKGGKKLLILKLITRHLNSEAVETSDDAGLPILLKLHSDLADILGKRKMKTLPSEMNLEGKDERMENLNTNVAIHKLREFKISGTVGSVDQEDTLSDTSLSFQMKQGKEAGYSGKEVCAAVIRAIKQGSNLRNYLESRGDVT